MKHNLDHFHCVDCDTQFQSSIHWYARRIITPPIPSKNKEKKYALVFECPKCFAMQWTHITEEGIKIISKLQSVGRVPSCV